MFTFLGETTACNQRSMLSVCPIHTNTHMAIAVTLSSDMITKDTYAGIEITDFQMPDKTSSTIKYLPDILKIHWTSCTIQCKKFN